MPKRDSKVLANWSTTMDYLINYKYVAKSSKARKILMTLDTQLSYFSYDFPRMNISVTEDTIAYYERRLVGLFKSAFNTFEYRINLFYSPEEIVGCYLTVIWIHRLLKANYVIGLPDLPIKKMKKMLVKALKDR